MELWSFYFLAKFYLYWRGYIGLSPLWNLLFLGFLLIPVSSKIKPLKLTADIILGFLLFWHDSWFPPLTEAVYFTSHAGAPTKEYIYRFLQGYLDIKEVVVLSVILAFCFAVRRRLRLTPIILALMLTAPLIGSSGGSRNGGDASVWLDSFYRKEAKRKVPLSSLDVRSASFDVIFLHVCSLSWDDLRVLGIDASRHPFLNQFQYWFTQFNAVTSYSGPAAMRLLRAGCGQQRHDALYRETSKNCYLLENLRDQGFKTYTVYNHNGEYQDFGKLARKWGRADEPMDVSEMPFKQRNFDNSPIYDDLALLRKWWEARQTAGVARAALYYNTVTLHEGAHWADDKQWWKRDRKVEYRQFLEKLLTGIDQFMRDVEGSGRNAVIVFVPEHGAALEGSGIQAPGLRDLPLPQITMVPVGVKLIGKRFIHAPRSPVIISQSTSFMAVSAILASFSSEGHSLEAIGEGLPATDFVAENQGSSVIRRGSEYLFFGKQKQWVTLPAVALQKRVNRT